LIFNFLDWNLGHLLVFNAKKENHDGHFWNQIVTVIDKEFVMINTFYIYLPLYLSYLFFVSPFLFDKDVSVLF